MEGCIKETLNTINSLSGNTLVPLAELEERLRLISLFARLVLAYENELDRRDD